MYIIHLFIYSILTMQTIGYRPRTIITVHCWFNYVWVYFTQIANQSYHCSLCNHCLYKRMWSELCVTICGNASMFFYVIFMISYYYLKYFYYIMSVVCPFCFYDCSNSEQHELHKFVKNWMIMFSSMIWEWAQIANCAFLQWMKT